MPAVPHRRLGLIVVVLIVDLGLAAAGAVLLGKGMTKSRPDPKPEAGSGSATPGQPTAPPAPPQPTSAEPPPPPAPPEPAPEQAMAAPAAKTVASRHHVVNTSASAKPPIAVATSVAAASSPADPYAGAAELDLAAQVDAALARVHGQIAKCGQDAAAHGQIRIAFQVLPDGHIAHAAAVENATGVASLATCLTGVISSITTSPHSGGATDFMRPFSYP